MYYLPTYLPKLELISFTSLVVLNNRIGLMMTCKILKW